MSLWASKIRLDACPLVYITFRNKKFEKKNTVKCKHNLKKYILE